MNISVAGIEKARELPDDFVYIDELIEDSVIDAKYAGTDNFLGCPVDGYEKPLVVTSREVAECCVKAADILREQGYILRIYDSYRPQRAVDHFCRWGEDLDDIRRKPLHYPDIEKAKMFEEGYVARKSTHTRGCAIDLSLIYMNNHQDVDMGARFDFMSPLSWPLSDDVTPEQKKNRMILREAMTEAGFKPLEIEYWHFYLDPEPHPDTYFDFPIR